MKILHISDLHLVSTGDRKDYQNHIRERFISFIKQIADEKSSAIGIRIDHIIITGDLRDNKTDVKADSVQMVDFVCDFVNEVMDATGVHNVQKVHIVPGNHDLDRVGSASTWEKKNSQFNLFFWPFCDKFYGVNNNPWRKNDGYRYCPFLENESTNGKNEKEKVGFII